jgi:DNA-binding NarL/FixJ family response regulator
MADAIRVIVADDHPLIRTGVRLSLSAEEDIEVVGEAATGDAATALCKESSPDVVLLDLSMPGPGPEALLTMFKEECPDMKIIVLSASDDDAHVRSLINAGINGYVLKDEASEMIADAIRTVVKGATWFSRSVMQTFMSPPPANKESSPLTELTGREQEILQEIARGQSNAQIALALHLAEQTVRNYTSRIYEKLGISSRAEAIIWAYQNGLVSEVPSGTDDEK